MVHLQQDAYDQVDVSVPLDRQREFLALVRGLIQRDYPFKDKEEAHRFFTQLTGPLKNLNYTPRDTKFYTRYLAQIDDLVKTLGRAPAAMPAEPEGLPPADPLAGKRPTKGERSCPSAHMPASLPSHRCSSTSHAGDGLLHGTPDPSC